MKLGRRDFLKLTTAAGIGVAVPKIIKGKAISSFDEAVLAKPTTEFWKLSVCTQCKTGCGMLVRIANESPVKLEGYPKHPISKGSLCLKGYAGLQELFHPDRIKAPLQKDNSNTFETISWEKAISEVSMKIKEVSPNEIAFLYGPTANEKFLEYFADVIGCKNLFKLSFPMNEAQIDAFKLMYGTENVIYDLKNTKLIVSFGLDWLQNLPSPEIQRIYSYSHGNQRPKVIHIESRFSVTASKSDMWVAIVPGTEAILALAIAHVILKEELYDKSVEHYHGFTEFKNLVLKKYTPESCEKITGVSKNTIDYIAREISSKKPVIVLGARKSCFTQIAVNSLNLLCGSINTATSIKEDESAKSAEKNPNSVKILFLYKANPVFLSQQPTRWDEKLKKIPFIVNLTPFLNETAHCSHLILPLSTALESWNYIESTAIDGTKVISCSMPVVEPLYDTLSMEEIIIRIARELKGKVSSKFPWKNAMDFVSEKSKDFLEKGFLTEKSAKEISKRFTPNLLMENEVKISSEGFKLIVYTPLAFSFGEGAHLPYLLSAISPYIREQWNTWVEINPESAKELGISNKDEVWIESSVGKIKVKARIYNGVPKNVLAIPFGLGHKGLGSNPAEIVPFKIDEHTGQPIWDPVNVIIKKV